MPRARKTPSPTPDAQSYRYPDADLPARPEIGAQAHFKKAKPPATYRFDSSLAPELNWDGQNPAREAGEAQLSVASHQLSVIQSALAKLLEKTTDPGDLVLDPTCGSGTTAYVAEQWGRRWITCDTSRVPLALARQRLLTATFDYYKIRPVGADVRRLTSRLSVKEIHNAENPRECWTEAGSVSLCWGRWRAGAPFMQISGREAPVPRDVRIPHEGPVVLDDHFGRIAHL
jgi:hypothetical protein